MQYLLVDANNLAARHYYANKELSRKDGFKTGLIYGVLKGLAYVKYTTQVSWSEVVVVWDGGRSETRCQMYPEYKQGRKLSSPKTPQEEADAESYYYQMNLVRGILPYLGLRQIKVPGVEADDIISVLTYLLEEDGHSSIVYSGDKDMHQLARPMCLIFDPKKDILTAEDIKKMWDVEQIDDILWLRAVTGDASDNIKGVPQVGEKRAKLALAQKKLANDLSQNTKWWSKVCDNQETVSRNIKLMRLPTTLEETFYTPEQCYEALDQFSTVTKRDIVGFGKECKKYELQSIIEEISRW